MTTIRKFLQWLVWFLTPQIEANTLIRILDNIGVKWEPHVTGAYIGSNHPNRKNVVLKLQLTITDPRVRFRKAPNGLPVHPWELTVAMRTDAPDESRAWVTIYKSQLSAIRGEQIILYKRVFGRDWERVIRESEAEILRLNEIEAAREHQKNFTPLDPEDWR